MTADIHRIFIGPVQMWAEEGAKYGHNASCHRCEWTLADYVKWTIVPLSLADLREFVVYHLLTPHPPPWITKVR